MEAFLYSCLGIRLIGQSPRRRYLEAYLVAGLLCESDNVDSSFLTSEGLDIAYYASQHVGNLGKSDPTFVSPLMLALQIYTRLENRLDLGQFVTDMELERNAPAALLLYIMLRFGFPDEAMELVMKNTFAIRLRSGELDFARKACRATKLDMEYVADLWQHA